ncbi:GNAT family N-acetyltransferase [Lysobacter tyrosinilyticus]
MEILEARSDEEIAATFDVMHQLRPHLQRHDYVARMRALQASDGLRLFALRDRGAVRAVATWRLMNMLYCGRLLYVDDLVTDEGTRSRGYGSLLIARLKDEARAHECSEIQLISNVKREGAHRFYFREDFGIECFHFRAQLKG